MRAKVLCKDNHIILEAPTNEALKKKWPILDFFKDKEIKRQLEIIDVKDIDNTQLNDIIMDLDDFQIVVAALVILVIIILIVVFKFIKLPHSSIFDIFSDAGMVLLKIAGGKGFARYFYRYFYRLSALFLSIATMFYLWVSRRQIPIQNELQPSDLTRAMSSIASNFTQDNSNALKTLYKCLKRKLIKTDYGFTTWTIEKMQYLENIKNDIDNTSKSNVSLDLEFDLKQQQLLEVLVGNNVSKFMKDDKVAKIIKTLELPEKAKNSTESFLSAIVDSIQHYNKDHDQYSIDTNKLNELLELKEQDTKNNKKIEYLLSSLNEDELIHEIQKKSLDLLTKKNFHALLEEKQEELKTIGIDVELLLYEKNPVTIDTAFAFLAKNLGLPTNHSERKEHQGGVVQNANIAINGQQSQISDIATNPIPHLAVSQLPSEQRVLPPEVGSDYPQSVPTSMSVSNTKKNKESSKIQELINLVEQKFDKYIKTYYHHDYELKDDFDFYQFYQIHRDDIFKFFIPNRTNTLSTRIQKYLNIVHSYNFDSSPIKSFLRFLILERFGTTWMVFVVVLMLCTNESFNIIQRRLKTADAQKDVCVNDSKIQNDSDVDSVNIISQHLGLSCVCVILLCIVYATIIYLIVCLFQIILKWVGTQNKKYLSIVRELIQFDHKQFSIDSNLKIQTFATKKVAKYYFKHIIIGFALCLGISLLLTLSYAYMIESDIIKTEEEKEEYTVLHYFRLFKMLAICSMPIYIVIQFVWTMYSNSK
jgi:hypothetical protein